MNSLNFLPWYFTYHTYPLRKSVGRPMRPSIPSKPSWWCTRESRPWASSSTGPVVITWERHSTCAARTWWKWMEWTGGPFRLSKKKLGGSLSKWTYGHEPERILFLSSFSYRVEFVSRLPFKRNSNRRRKKKRIHISFPLITQMMQLLLNPVHGNSSGLHVFGLPTGSNCCSNGVTLLAAWTQKLKPRPFRVRVKLWHLENENGR